MSESEFNDYNEIIYERDKLKEQNEKLKEALEAAQPYVIGAYECAFPDDRENEYVRNKVEEALKSCES